MGSQEEPICGLSNDGPISDHHLPLNPQTGGFEKSPFQLAVKQLEIDEIVNRARLMRHFLALNLVIEQSCSFRLSPKRRSERRSNTICVVVDPCGDDLVNNNFKKR